jgi:hypothetical protein
MQAADCWLVSTAAFRITFEIVHGDFIAILEIERLNCKQTTVKEEISWLQIQ